MNGGRVYDRGNGAAILLYNQARLAVLRYRAPALFVAEYDDGDRVASGDGDVGEGEEIETIELGLDEAMIDSGAIQDGKTIMLLQHAHRVGSRNLAAARAPDAGPQ